MSVCFLFTILFAGFFVPYNSISVHGFKKLFLKFPQLLVCGSANVWLQFLLKLQQSSWCCCCIYFSIKESFSLYFFFIRSKKSLWLLSNFFHSLSVCCYFNIQNIKPFELTLLKRKLLWHLENIKKNRSWLCFKYLKFCVLLKVLEISSVVRLLMFFGLKIRK